MSVSPVAKEGRGCRQGHLRSAFNNDSREDDASSRLESIPANRCAQYSRSFLAYRLSRHCLRLLWRSSLRIIRGDVIAIFSQFGEPVFLKLARDKETGKSKGFGWLKYEDQRSTDLAVDNLGGADIGGRLISVDHARYKARDDEDPEEFKVGWEDMLRREGQALSEDESSEEEVKRPMLPEERELALLMQDHDDDDPMKGFLIEEKKKEVEEARRKAEKKDRKHKHRHHRSHRSRRDGSEEDRHRRSRQDETPEGKEDRHRDKDSRRHRDDDQDRERRRDRDRDRRRERKDDDEDRHRDRDRGETAIESTEGIGTTPMRSHDTNDAGMKTRRRKPQGEGVEVDRHDGATIKAHYTVKQYFTRSKVALLILNPSNAHPKFAQH
ncbi:hypothetical protein Lal_00015454 [Lupinus albus]|nr:hypothetical protein Lal_00015454 [Lupinus albus]